MSNPANRRTRKRIEIKSKLRHSTYQTLGIPVFQENTTLDLSSKGVSFETEREYSKGNLVLLEIEAEKKSLKILVCVAWTKNLENDRRRVGAELIAIDPIDQLHLQKMLGHSEPKKAQKKIKKGAKKVAKKSSKKTTKKKLKKSLKKKKK